MSEVIALSEILLSIEKQDWGMLKSGLEHYIKVCGTDFAKDTMEKVKNYPQWRKA